MITIKVFPEDFKVILKEIGDILKEDDRYTIDEDKCLIYVQDQEAKYHLSNELIAVAAMEVTQDGEMSDYGLYLEGITDNYFENE